MSDDRMSDEQPSVWPDWHRAMTTAMDVAAPGYTTAESRVEQVEVSIHRKDGVEYHAFDGRETAATAVLNLIIAALDKAEAEGAQRIKITTLRDLLYVE